MIVSPYLSPSNDPPMNETLKTLLTALDEGFDRPAWHGPNLTGTLRGLTLDALLKRPVPGAHNIWELALHCAYWKHTARRRIAEGDVAPFPLAGSNFFPRERGATIAQWRRERNLLMAEHRALRAEVAKLPPERLERRARGSRHSVRRTVLGIVAHDVYHAGQISLLRR